jgi:hypothetical protein
MNDTAFEQQEDKIKEVSVEDGYVVIDLLCGLRLSAPIVPLPESCDGPRAAAACEAEGREAPPGTALH